MGLRNDLWQPHAYITCDISYSGLTTSHLHMEIEQNELVERWKILREVTNWMGNYSLLHCFWVYIGV